VLAAPATAAAPRRPAGMAPMVGDYPAWLCQNSNGKWPIKIVDFPSWKMVDLSIAMLVYQRVYGFYGFLQHYMGLYGII